VTKIIIPLHVNNIMAISFRKKPADMPQVTD